ncbi:MAG TPA: DUF192 domain-containing protein [Candidatus Limnocylindrales bacterium]|nr:DUF192 domain-containing protein [Candidatus Limnocylindrales bacterium]
MTEWRVIRNVRTGEIVLARARICADFWSVFRGLQFTRPLDDNMGLLFLMERESRTQTAIHMLNVTYPIGVLWLNATGEVVHTALAKPWRLYYGSPTPALCFIEASPAILSRVAVGDRLRYDEVAP